MIAPANEFDVLVDGAAFWARLREDIAQARSSILVQTLSFEGDVAGKALAAALSVSRCPDRRILVDSFNRYFQSDRFVYAPRNLVAPEVREEVRETRAMIDDLVRQGVEVSYTNAAGALLHRLPGRDHKKLVLIDGRIAYLGGINFCEHNFLWHDMMLRIERPAVAAALKRDFEATWRNVLAPEVSHHGDVELLNFDGVGNERTSQRVLQIIHAAREHIYVLSPYMTFPFTNALRAAVRRGVQVTVVAPAENNRGFLATYMEAEAARSGFDLRLYRGRMSHMKAMLVDGQTLVVGSSNFDWLTYHLLGEIMAVITNPQAIAAFEARVLAPDLAASTPADAADAAIWKAILTETLMKAAASAARRICRWRSHTRVRPLLPFRPPLPAVARS